MFDFQIVLKYDHKDNINSFLQSDELSAQKKLRSELMNSEDVNAQLRKEYEMLRIEFEQNLAANEQTGPINREMRHLLSSLQNHNNQLKGELHRYKRKYKDANAEVPKVKINSTYYLLNNLKSMFYNFFF